MLITYTFHYFNEEEGEGHIGTSFWSIAAPGWGKKGLDRKKIINYLIFIVRCRNFLLIFQNMSLRKMECYFLDLNKIISPKDWINSSL